MRTPHWRRGEALKEFPRTRDHDRESESPESAAHQVHSDQTRHEKINVASARLRHLLFTDAHDVRSSFTLLQHVVNEESCTPAFRTRRIETISERVVLGFD